MGFQGDMAREGEIKDLCEKLKQKIEKYPEAAKALKEIGIEMLNGLQTRPEWIYEYYKLFG